jgi:hypothetical protein
MSYFKVRDFVLVCKWSLHATSQARRDADKDLAKSFSTTERPFTLPYRALGLTMPQNRAIMFCWPPTVS